MARKMKVNLQPVVRCGSCGLKTSKPYKITARNQTVVVMTLCQNCYERAAAFDTRDWSHSECELEAMTARALK